MSKKEENNEDNELEALNPEPSKNQQNYKTTKNKLEATAELSAATGELRSIGIAIANLVDKSAKALDRVAQLPAIRDIHFIAMGISGLSLLLKLIKQVLFVFTLNSDERRQWWQKKTFGHKLAYILKTVLAAASIAVAAAAIFVPAAAAVILLATCYISASVQGFIDVYRKLPKLITQFKESSENCRKIETDFLHAENDSTRATLSLDLRTARNLRSQHLLGIVSNVGNIAFNTAYIIGAALTIAIPPVGVIMLGITALTNIVFGVSTLIANTILTKKAKILVKPQEHLIKKEDKEEISEENEEIIQQHADLKEEIQENNDTIHNKESNGNNEQESNPKIEESHLFKDSHHHFSTEASLELALTVNLRIEKSLLKESKELHSSNSHYVFIEDEDKVYFVTPTEKPKLVEGEELKKIKKQLGEAIAKQQKLKSQSNSSEIKSPGNHQTLLLSEPKKLIPHNKNISTPSEKQENESESEGETGLENEKTIDDEDGEGGNEKEETDNNNESPSSGH